MSDKFTEGEWYVDGYKIKSPVCSLELAKITVFNEGKANARLMACSPEMHNHIKIIKEMIDDGDILFRHPMSKMTLELRTDQLLEKIRGNT